VDKSYNDGHRGDLVASVGKASTTMATIAQETLRVGDENDVRSVTFGVRKGEWWQVVVRPEDGSHPKIPLVTFLSLESR